MRRHLTAIPGGKLPAPDSSYWQHPVHSKSDAKRLEVLGAHFATETGEHPYIARLAVSVLYAELGKLREDTDWAVCDNALQDLAAYMSKPAPKDDASPFGIPRPGGVA